MTSIMERMERPAPFNVRTAESRPEPIPFTNTFTSLRPLGAALRITSSATWDAANGVDFFGPLNPKCPALDHAITLPFTSVMVMMVLL